MPEGQKNPQIWNLKEHLAAGRISRREFTSRLLALGLTMPAIGTILAAPVPAAVAATAPTAAAAGPPPTPPDRSPMVLAERIRVPGRLRPK